MKPTKYSYEAEEYDLDNIYNDDDDRRTDTRDISAVGTYGGWAVSAPDMTAWDD